LTWLVAASATVALGCVLASTRRLVWALCPTPFDARLLASALGADASRNAAKLREAFGARERSDWEVAVLRARAEPSTDARDALLSEQLTEFDGRAQRWSRVPRVCASVATSAGFLFASVGLIRDLSTLDPTSSGAEAMQSALFAALDALAIGVAATSFCAAVHVRARRAARDRTAAAERLIEKLGSS
jgi:hypothetical protein